MSRIADFDFNTSLLTEGVIFVSQMIRRDFPVAKVNRILQQLVDEARIYVPQHLSQDEQLEKLFELFYKKWGFGGASGVYRLSDAIWLDNVLEARQGAPISLGIIFLHLAQQIGLPLMPVIFPTQLILRADWLDEEMWLINPLNGETLSEHLLEMCLTGHLGLGVELEECDLDESENILVVRNMLEILKISLMEEQQTEIALSTCEAILSFDPDDPYAIRDRGLIYAQLECNHIAVSDLNYFIEHCPEDPVSEIIKLQIHSIELKQVILH